MDRTNAKRWIDREASSTGLDMGLNLVDKISFFLKKKKILKDTSFYIKKHFDKINK